MAVAVVVAVIRTIISQRVRAFDLGMICIDLVSVNIAVWMRFICHVPQTLGTHEKHREGEQLADEWLHRSNLTGIFSSIHGASQNE